MGSYDELIGKQGDFADFIKNHTFDDGDSDDNPSENGEDTKSNNRSKINLRRSTISKKNGESSLFLTLKNETWKKFNW